jgi:tRNA (cytidine/uridine-2'-O-)-methyltransferase
VQAHCLEFISRRLCEDATVPNSTPKKLQVVLVEPENPYNTGGIVRTCALLGAALHLVKPYGFASVDGDVRRSSMSYLDVAEVTEHQSWEDFVGSLPVNSRCWAFWDEGTYAYDSIVYEQGDYLVFGRESVGLGETILKELPSVHIPMPGVDGTNRSDHRDHSLNVSVSVGIALTHAMHRIEGWQ